MNKYIPFFLATLVLVAGCATTAGRNYQPDLEALNAKVASLQGQLDAKNRELAGFQDQIRSLQSQLQLTANAKEEAERRLVQALDKLAGSSTGSVTTSSDVVAKKGSYIK